MRRQHPIAAGAAYLFLIVAACVAFHLSDAHAVCAVKTTAWDQSHREILALTQPRSLTDPRLTVQQRALRATNNAGQAQTRKTLLESLGRRPSC